MMDGNMRLFKYVGHRLHTKTKEVVGVYTIEQPLGIADRTGRIVKENGMTESIFPDNNVIRTNKSVFIEKAEGGNFTYLPNDYQWVDSTKPETTDMVTDTPTFDKLPSKSETPTMTFTAIGSRGTRIAIPEEVSRRFGSAVKWLETQGFTVRTGDAIGMDQLARDNATKKEVYTAKDATPETRLIAREIHPAPQSVDKTKNPEYTWGLHARNTFQVFGRNLDTPSDFVIAWTPDGAVNTETRTVATGGTGQAIDMASRKGIPVFNFADPTAPRRLFEYVNTLLGKTTEKTEEQTEEYPFTADDANTVFSTAPERVQAMVTEMGITSFDNVTAEQMKQLRDEYAHCKI
jgi:hypothetical protein